MTRQQFRDGDMVILRHRKYGEIRSVVHVSSNALPYIALGFTHLTLGVGLEKAGWKVSRDPAQTVRELIDGWDVETEEATQGALVDQIREVFGWPTNHTNGGRDA